VLLIFKLLNPLTAKVAKFYTKVTKKEKKEITQSFIKKITDMIFSPEPCALSPEPCALCPEPCALRPEP
jgi:hypothetical protein